MPIPTFGMSGDVRISIDRPLLYELDKAMAAAKANLLLVHYWRWAIMLTAFIVLAAMIPAAAA